jgi:hypothetical protein
MPIAPESRVSQPAISTCFARLQLAPRQAYKSLTLWPLVLREDASPSAAPPYEALADALDAGRLRVDEVSAHGVVSQVRVENDGDVAVLVLFGEELRGAKQNRIANASFLVGPKSTVAIDVSCVEAQRWTRRSPGDRFIASGEVVSSAMRRKIADHVAASRLRGRFNSDQQEVWKEVGLRLGGSGTTSRSQAYADYVGKRRSELQEFATVFHPIERQAGFVAAIGDEIAGIEVVGRPEVFARCFGALSRAYAIDAVDAALLRPRAKPARVFDAPEPFVAAVQTAAGSATRSLGLGDDVRVSGGGIAAAALVAVDVVHLTAFPADTD